MRSPKRGRVAYRRARRVAQSAREAAHRTGAKSAAKVVELLPLGTEGLIGDAQTRHTAAVVARETEEVLEAAHLAAGLAVAVIVAVAGGRLLGRHCRLVTKRRREERYACGDEVPPGNSWC